MSYLEIAKEVFEIESNGLVGKFFEELKNNN